MYALQNVLSLSIYSKKQKWYMDFAGTFLGLESEHARVKFCLLFYITESRKVNFMLIVETTLPNATSFFHVSVKLHILTPAEKSFVIGNFFFFNNSYFIKCVVSLAPLALQGGGDRQLKKQCN